MVRHKTARLFFFFLLFILQMPVLSAAQPPEGGYRPPIFEGGDDRDLGLQGVEEGISLQTTDLHRAIGRGDKLNEIQGLVVRKGLDINAISPSYDTALDMAPNKGPIHRYLLDQGGLFAVQVAAKRGDKKTLQACLGRRPQGFDVRDKRKRTPLHYALSEGHVDLVPILLRAGAPIGQQALDSDEMTPGQYCLKKQRKRWEKYVNEHVYIPFLAALRGGDLPVATRFMHQGALSEPGLGIDQGLKTNIKGGEDSDYSDGADNAPEFFQAGAPAWGALGYGYVVSTLALFVAVGLLYSYYYKKTNVGHLDKVLSGHTDEVNSVVYSPDGTRVVSGSDDKTVRIWDVATNKLLRTLSGHTDCVFSVAYSPDGSRVASASWDKTLRMWDAATGELLHTLEGHADRVEHVAFSPDGSQVVSGSDDHTLRMWDVATGELLHVLEGHLGRVNSVVYRADGDQIASGSDDGTIGLWNVATGEATAVLVRGHKGAVFSVAYSPDGRQIASAGDDCGIQVWDTTSGKVLHTLKGHDHYINSIVYSPDGKQIISVSRDGTVRLWDVSCGQLLHTLEEHDTKLWSVAFSPDGAQFVLASGDRQVYIWRLGGKIEAIMRSLRSLYPKSNLTVNL